MHIDRARVTSAETYDMDLAVAEQFLRHMVMPNPHAPDEREKAIADALNNTWCDGMTLGRWVDRAHVVALGGSATDAR